MCELVLKCECVCFVCVRTCVFIGSCFEYVFVFVRTCVLIRSCVEAVFDSLTNTLLLSATANVFVYVCVCVHCAELITSVASVHACTRHINHAHSRAHWDIIIARMLSLPRMFAMIVKTHVYAYICSRTLVHAQDGTHYRASSYTYIRP